MFLVRSLAVLSVAAVLGFGGFSSEAAAQKKPKKSKQTAHGTFVGGKAPTAANPLGFLVLEIKATKKQGGGIRQEKFVIAAETAIVKHGPKKVELPALWTDLVPGAKVRLALHPTNPNLAVGVIITSLPKKKKTAVVP